MRIVFVCTANMCRSPMAEVLFKQIAAERGLAGIEVSSSGVFASLGGPAISGAVRTAARAGLDLSGHSSSPFSPAELGPGDLVYVMEAMHRRQIVAGGGVDEESVRLLGSLVRGGSAEIDDPVGGPEVAYDQCFDRIKLCVAALATRLEDERLLRT